MFPLKVIGECDVNKTGSEITFLPDTEIFEETVYDYDILKTRLREMAFLTKGIKIILRDDREDKREKEFYYEGGIKEFYTVEELVTIILRSAKVLEVGIDRNGAYALARRSRGTPRLANRLLKRVRDFAQVKYEGYITEEVANYALDLLDVDKEGLDQTDRGLLQVMIEKFLGGPVGLDTLAAAIGEDAGTIEDVYEPYLLMNGFIQRTPRGRIVTDHAYHHLGISREIIEK